MTFVYVLEGKIGRIDKDNNPHNITGLCTSDFSSCNMIVLISADNKRYVLMHADFSMNQNDLVNELEWVGEGCYAYVCYRQEGHQSAVFAQVSQDVTRNLISSELKSKFKFMVVPEDQEVVTIQLDRTKPELRQKTPAEVFYHPQSIMAVCYHKIIGMSLLWQGNYQKYCRKQPLLFNSTQWQVSDSYNLLSQFQNVLQRRDISAKASSIQIFWRILGDDHSWRMTDAAYLHVFLYLTAGNEQDLEKYVGYSCQQFRAYADALTLNESDRALINIIFEKLREQRSATDIKNFQNNNENVKKLKSQNPDLFLVAEQSIIALGTAVLLLFDKFPALHQLPLIEIAARDAASASGINASETQAKSIAHI